VYVVWGKLARVMMTQNGEKIQEYLVNYQYEISLGIEQCDHRYSQNGTISCIKNMFVTKIINTLLNFEFN